MRNTRYFLLVVVILLGLVLAACGGAAPAAAPAAPAAPDAATEAAAPATGGESAAPADSAGKTELVLMGWSSSPAENERLQKIVDGYNTANPAVHVTLSQVPDYDTKLQVSLAGGSPPDVFYVDSFKFLDLAAANALDAGGDKIDSKDDFYPNLAAAFTKDGVMYCPPKDFSTLGLVYNTALFDAAGIDYPTAAWTWDDLAAAAAKLTAADKSVYGMSVTPDMARWLAFLYQAGGSVYNADATQMTINSPEAKKALDFYVGLVKDGFAAQPADLSAGWPGEAFGQQKAAMVVEGNWIMPYLKDQFPDVKFAVAELPKGPADAATMSFTVCYAAPAGGKNLEESWKLINYLTGTEGMKAWTDLGLAMPTRKSLEAGWAAQYPEQAAFQAGAAYAYPWQFVAGFKEVLDAINSGIQQAFAGSMSTDQVLKDADTVGAEILAKQK